MGQECGEEQRVILILVSGKRIKWMDMESISGRMEIDMKDSSKNV